MTDNPGEKPFDGPNAGYVQALYEDFARNPESVPEQWRRFFEGGAEQAVRAGLIIPEGLAENGAAVAPVVAPATAAPDRPTPAVTPESSPKPPTGPAAMDAPSNRLLSMVVRATSLVQAFRDHGHQLAQIDPLGAEPPGHPQLDPSFFGMKMEELEEIPASVVLGNGADEPLSDTLRRLRDAYCGSAGYEFEHLEDPEIVRWLWDQVESGVHTQPLPDASKVALLERLSQVEGLEQFLHRAYLGQKRFSIEGTDMMVPMLDLAISEAAAAGGREVVIGMAHRGRLNVLAHILGIGYEEILRSFEGIDARGALDAPGTGDVKYHHGAEYMQALPDGSSIRVGLASNPSHLEFVNPVVEGVARVRQFAGSGPDDPQETLAVVPILIHGDAAFSGEGVVAETLNLARLRGYNTGGTIHIIANNQVGFTTDPEDGRSTSYASDLAKGFSFPIIHVNADDPDACLGAMRLAMAYRTHYQDDIVIDLVGYRRHGHNEGDEPAFTQPRLYERIAAHPTVRAQWATRLADEGVVDSDRANAMEEEVVSTLRAAQDAVKEEKDLASNGSHVEEEHVVPETSVDLDTLGEVNAASIAVPEGFTIHPKLKRTLDKRVDEFGEETALDWAHAEALAFGSLLKDGVPIRLTGQDSERGTFSQRHLVFHDVETGATEMPLSRIGSARFEVYNSPLSEAGPLGFEYGYSVAADRDLVLWEAQFGDFVNAAQVVLDQFISSGWEKWGERASLGLLLPHGYEGQGPEHSSARLERFLQLCAEGNLRVVYPTTPGQYFHLLRRQALMRPQRPMIFMTPKSLLRHPMATTPVRELVEGEFQPVLDDPNRADDRSGVTRLVLCSGKVYYDIQGYRERDQAPSSAVARIEALYPFPAEELETVVARYPDLEEVVWTQEEPRNMGALTFVGPRLRAAIPRQIPLRYVARPGRASTAEGKASDHLKEQERIVRESLGLDPKE